MRQLQGQLTISAQTRWLSAVVEPTAPTTLSTFPSCVSEFSASGFRGRLAGCTAGLSSSSPFHFSDLFIEYQKFLMALSVRPGSSFACTHIHTPSAA